MTTTRRPGSILVTGAGRGIGRATAELFLSRGWRVGMYDVDADVVAEAAGGRAVHGVLDVRYADRWTAALQEFCGDGGLDVLVNNAGVLASGPFADTDPGTHRRMVDVNVTGVINGAAAGHPFLRRSRGLLLNLCSASALYGQPGLATYGATKSAVSRTPRRATPAEPCWSRVTISVATNMGSRLRTRIPSARHSRSRASVSDLTADFVAP